jgi:hypothetical protein
MVVCVLFLCFCFGRCCAQLHAYLAAASRTQILMPRIGSRRARTDEPPAPVGVQRARTCNQGVHDGVSACVCACMCGCACVRIAVGVRVFVFLWVCACV